MFSMGGRQRRNRLQVLELHCVYLCFSHTTARMLTTAPVSEITSSLKFKLAAKDMRCYKAMIAAGSSYVGTEYSGLSETEYKTEGSAAAT